MHIRSMNSSHPGPREPWGGEQQKMSLGVWGKDGAAWASASLDSYVYMHLCLEHRINLKKNQELKNYRRSWWGGGVQNKDLETEDFIF